MANNHTAEVDGAQRALGDFDFQAKFVHLIEHLAEWDEALGDLPTVIAFGREFVRDRESMRYLMESTSEEIPLHVDRDTLIALAEFVEGTCCAEGASLREGVCAGGAGARRCARDEGL
ncbi:hypothetical protein [Alicyclobacillus fructus]|uniref:hypothetical protein n=1 Tax=Alicyclobacillus fructus TaxID=2816082 RepID=UPI001F302A03|nr:hypothetical protein [Alicyclobacillus fructus]